MGRGCGEGGRVGSREVKEEANVLKTSRCEMQLVCARKVVEEKMIGK